jgi:NAD(P)-dependent dehydrogenase (short-subunit alcohol dehydrogenase family)
MSKVWFVTGATRGIGAEIAKAALAAGNKVVATGRRPETVAKALGTSASLLVRPLDVTNEDQVKAAVQAALQQFGRIDVLVNNAGYGQLGVVEETSLQAIRAEFETNVLGLIAVTQAILPIMRKQRSGRVFNISSVAGLASVFGGAIYAASKFAVEGLSQGLAEELATFGVHLTVVSPGFFRTDFLDSSSVKYADKPAIKEYAEKMAEFRAFHDNRSHAQAGDPVKLGKVLLHLAELDNPPVSFIAGSDAVQWATGTLENRLKLIADWKDLSASSDGDWEADKKPLAS